MKNKYFKSFFSGIEEALHFTPVGMLTVPLFGFRHKRTDLWIGINAWAMGIWISLLFIEVLKHI